MDKHELEQAKAKIEAALKAQEINTFQENNNDRARIYAAAVNNPEAARMIVEMQQKEEAQKQSANRR